MGRYKEEFDEEFKVKVEKRFACFMEISVRGIQLDDGRKQAAKYTAETSLEAYMDVCPSSYVCRELMHFDDVFRNNVKEDLLMNGDVKLCKALKALTERQLEILLLVEIEEKTEKETAGMFGVTQQCIHTAKMQAKARLIQLLTEEVG